MPTIRRILETALYCDDLAHTARFYRRFLPASPLVEGERLIALDAGEGTVLLLFQRGRSSASLPTPGGVVPGHDGSGPTHLAFAVDAEELPIWERQLAEWGVMLESRVKWPRGGESLYFRDPDGRSVELATPGTWATY
jgi:catechol 2,3-dioxygenase-like lactoylglutathione lyase family enzyme